MDENNKDKLINADKKDSDELMEDTIVFTREPDTIIQSTKRADSSRDTKRQSPRPNPARPQNIPIELQNTAKLQGGAVIRPLKPTRSPNARSSQPNGAQSSGASGNIQPNGSQSSGASGNMQPNGARLNGGVSGNMQSGNTRSGSSASGGMQSNRANPNSSRQGRTQAGAMSGSQPKNAQPENAQRNIQNNSRQAVQPRSNTPRNETIYPTQPRVDNSNMSQPRTNPNANRANGSQPSRGQGQMSVVRTPVQSQQRVMDDYEIDESTWRRTPNKPSRANRGRRDSASSAIMSAVKAVIYIVFVIAVSIPLSIFVINTANDVFAFVKEEKVIEVVIPEYATIDDVGDILGEAGVIKYPWAFKLWSYLKTKNNQPTFVAGTYEVSTTENYDMLRLGFQKSASRATIRLTIPEGYTVDEIIDLFVSNGIGTKEKFVEVINNYDFDYPFLDDLVTSSDRIYRLEGYLFPDTYEFYTDSSEEAAIAKLLDNFNRKFIEEYYDRCQELGITVDEAITLASMIEKEAKYADEMGDVSSVFHNRLDNSSTYPYLESDATIMYAIAHDTGSRLDNMTGDDLEYETAYNTYTHKGLPPGPIANPGLNSIKYALYPNETNYYYFVSDSSGRMLFATTYEEHLANINTARSGQ